MDRGLHGLGQLLCCRFDRNRHERQAEVALHIGNSTHCCDDHWHARHESFDHCQREAFSGTGHDNTIQCTERITDLGYWRIENGIAPKDPQRFAERWKEERFRRWQHRREQTEARIAIFKNEFLGGPLLAKGIEGQDREVGWAALTHNLWLLADLRRAESPPLPRG